jgi:hyperosmotically inducible periplasmic protein
MKKFQQACLLTVILSAISLSILAETPDLIDQNGYRKEFKSWDTDNNTKLSPSELKDDKYFNSGGFAKADKNKNGSLNEDEYSTYKSDVQQRESKRVAGDSAITTKIKSKYLVEKNFRSFDVSVETKDKIVMLSGFVDNEETKKRAGEIASRVKGVKEVRNGLMVKP